MSFSERGDRRYVPLQELPADLWATLQDRQRRLPLARIQRVWQWHALCHNEQRAALRLADRHHLTGHEGVALFHYHIKAVERLGTEAIPKVLRHADQVELARPPGEYVTLRLRGRTRHFRRPLPSGWLTWFGNRRVGIRDAWFRLTWRY